MNRWQIGDVKISRFVESEGAWPGTWILPNGTPENLRKEAGWLAPNFIDEEGRCRMSIHALVIESQGKRIVVDTCIGNDKLRSNPYWNKLSLPFLDDLKKAGYLREAIEFRGLHASARRSRRMEHDAEGRQVGADVSQRALRDWRR